MGALERWYEADAADKGIATPHLPPPAPPTRPTHTSAAAGAGAGAAGDRGGGGGGKCGGAAAAADEGTKGAQGLRGKRRKSKGNKGGREDRENKEQRGDKGGGGPPLHIGPSSLATPLNDAPPSGLGLRGSGGGASLPPWRKEVVREGVPRQGDGAACGVFMCAYAQLLAAGVPPPWSFSQVREGEEGEGCGGVGVGRSDKDSDVILYLNQIEVVLIVFGYVVHQRFIRGL